MRPNSNPAFWRALHSLAHPVSVAAVLLLLFNDHWLRWQHPSWLTGKLGDFAWLVFAPFIAAAALAWVLPRRERLIGLTAFTFIGLWFALAKTVPAVHGLTVQASEAVIGWRGTLRLDASDLLTLPALLLGWWVWQRAGNTPLTLRPLAWAALGLGVVGTLATSPPRTDFGMTCLDTINQGVIATSAGYPVGSGFISSDGGKSWASYDATENVNLTRICPASLYSDAMFEVANLNDSSIRYRFHPAQSIERTVDGGQTWQLDYDLSELSKDVRRIYHQQKHFTGYVKVANPGPFDALIDRDTGNLIVAMGQDGILLRDSTGEWHWVSVGAYGYVEIDGSIPLLPIFNFELLIAFELFCLMISSVPRKYAEASGLSCYFILCWILWGMGILTLEPRWPTGSWGFSGLVPFTIILFVLVLGLISAIFTLASYRNLKIPLNILLLTIILALFAAALFMCPYLFWLNGIIPQYAVAARVSAIAGILAAAAGYFYIQRLLPKPAPQLPTEGEADPGS